MISKRYHDLLKEVQMELDAGISPLNHEFLVRNNVTYDECRDLIVCIAESIDDYCLTTGVKDG